MWYFGSHRRNFISVCCSRLHCWSSCSYLAWDSCLLLILYSCWEPFSFYIHYVTRFCCLNVSLKRQLKLWSSHTMTAHTGFFFLAPHYATNLTKANKNQYIIREKYLTHSTSSVFLMSLGLQNSRQVIIFYKVDCKSTNGLCAHQNTRRCSGEKKNAKRMMNE